MHGDITMASICLSLMADDVELLSVPICHPCILSDEVSVHIFCLFTHFVRLVIGSFVCLLLSFENFSLNSEYKSFLRYTACVSRAVP